MAKKMKKRAPFIQPASEPQAAINVTPLVDVVLVLLIIFMVVTPLLDKQLTVAVPNSEKVESIDEVPEDQLLVSVEKNGDLLLNKRKISPENYVAKLRKKLAPRAPANKVVFVAADEEASYARLVIAIDGAKVAGAKVVGMSTDPPDDEQKL